MIHAEELDRVLHEQIEFTGKSPSIQAYLENMGICSDCLATVGLSYAIDQLGSIEELAERVGLDPEDEDAAEQLELTTITVSFTRGVIIGLMLGREHKA